VWWYAYPPRPEALTDDQISMMGAAQMRHWLVGLLEADRSPGARIVCSTTGEIPYNNQYDLPTAPRWHRGRIVILGDAAHAVSPSSVQGCSLACEDAVVLALCLRRSSSVERALAHYERIRRSRVERVHKWGSQMSITTKRGLAARAVSPLVLPAITGHIGQRHHMGKLSWMFGHHITWNQPTSVLT
jgi:2-polyprenyl-6-methoxyphenol hydroxylase-like FAD-dependent oxidoreductase